MALELGIHHYAEAFCLVAGLFFIRKWRHTYMQWFVPFVAAILFIELLSNYLHTSYRYPTLWLSELANALSCGFYAFLFYQVYRSARWRRLLMVTMLLYLILCGAAWLIFGLDKIFTITIVVGGILQIVCSGALFYQCLLDDEEFLSRQMISHLFMAAGILIFYAGIEIVIAAIPYIRENNLQLLGKPMYNTIPRLLSAIMYPCFCIAFYLWEPPQKRT